jgi:hypothetical protein
VLPPLLDCLVYPVVQVSDWFLVVAGGVFIAIPRRPREDKIIFDFKLSEIGVEWVWRD